MGLHVVQFDPQNAFGSRFTADFSRGEIVVESDTPRNGSGFSASIEELGTQDARHAAIAYAKSMGVGNARINGSPSAPFPVNKDGIPLDSVRDANGQPLPLRDPRMQPARYRITVPVTQPII